MPCAALPRKRLTTGTSGENGGERIGIDGESEMRAESVPASPLSRHLRFALELTREWSMPSTPESFLVTLT